MHSPMETFLHFLPRREFVSIFQNLRGFVFRDLIESGRLLYEEIRDAKGKRTAEGGALVRPRKQKKGEALRVRDFLGVRLARPAAGVFICLLRLLVLCQRVEVYASLAHFAEVLYFLHSLTWPLRFRAS